MGSWISTDSVENPLWPAYYFFPLNSQATIRLWHWTWTKEAVNACNPRSEVWLEVWFKAHWSKRKLFNWLQWSLWLGPKRRILLCTLFLHLSSDLLRALFQQTLISLLAPLRLLLLQGEVREGASGQREGHIVSKWKKKKQNSQLPQPPSVVGRASLHLLLKYYLWKGNTAAVLHHTVTLQNRLGQSGIWNCNGDLNRKSVKWNVVNISG